MKNSGLQNRFPDSVRICWLYWHDCMVCGRNNWEVLHHIISPTVKFYVGGEHNKSVLNSSPVHNYGADFGLWSCHIGNDAYLHREDVLKNLLLRTYEAQKDEGYELTDIDKEFMNKYQDLYPNDIIGKEQIVVSSQKR